MSDNGDWEFNGMLFGQRADAALHQFEQAMKQLAAFQSASRSGDPVQQQEAVTCALIAIRDLLKVMLLDELLRAKSVHALGPRPADDASDDAQTVHVLRELYVVLDWFREIAPLDNIVATIVDIRRLVVDRLPPRTFRRNHYADARTRDGTELADREFLVLLTYFVAAKDQVTPRVLLERLGVGVSHKAFEQWGTQAAGTARWPVDQRPLMTAAGAAEHAGGGLSLAQAAQLADRSKHVLLRDDPQWFPDLAGLIDHEKLRKLFAKVLRSGAFSRA
jgi:hypothetical protein